MFVVAKVQLTRVVAPEEWNLDRDIWNDLEKYGQIKIDE